jgi:single-strand DNA-binding protein
MSNSMNKVILVGNLGADPELRQFENSSALKFRLATTKVWNDRLSGDKRERTDWHNVVVWGKRASGLHGILRKGAKVMVEGRLETHSYDDDKGNTKYFTEVNASDIILTGRREGVLGEVTTPAARPGSSATAASPTAASATASSRKTLPRKGARRAAAPAQAQA